VLALLFSLTLLVTCDGADHLRERFATTPFAADAPRWCERYHHAHFDAGSIRLTRSDTASADECALGEEAGRALSCTSPGCDPCGCAPPCSPCAKAADVNGNAVLMTTSDAPGARRVAVATFVIERAMPAGSHIGLYVALHPHCHTTVQGLLVADGAGEFHLNVAALNEYIGGDSTLYAACREDPFSAISPPLAERIVLREGARYRWRLAARLEPNGHVRVSSTVRPVGGGSVRAGRYVFSPANAARWFGAAGGAARYAFGAQFSRAPSPSGGDPVLRLLEFAARPAPRLSAGSARSRADASR